MDISEMRGLGFNPDALQTFDPQGGIINEPNNPNRGQYSAPNVSLDAVFTLNVQNCTTDNQAYELFGAANSIVEIPNSGFYQGNGTGTNFRPFTAEQTLCLIGKVATTAEAGEGAIVPPPMVIYDDRNGNLVYIDGMTLTQWSGFFDTQGPLTASTIGVVTIISCSQRTYRALMSDLRDLVLYIHKTLIEYPTSSGKRQSITVSRPKSFGGFDSNTIEPSQFFDPYQQQTNEIAVPVSYFIDKLTSFYSVSIGSGNPAVILEPMNFTFFVSAFQNNGVMLSGMVK